MFHSRRLSNIAVFVCASVLLTGIGIKASESISITEPSVLSPNGRDDHNDTPDSATIIPFPHEGDYIIDPPGDIDWYRMHLDAGTLILIYTERINDSELDPRAIFYGPHDESGNDVDPTSWIYNDDDSHGDLQPEIRLLVAETGYYFLRISYYQDIPTGTPSREPKAGIKLETGEYRLFAEILPNQPDICVSPQEFDFAIEPGETETQILTIRNEGNIDLDVISITDDQEWWLDELPVNFVLPPDSSFDVTVGADATAMDEGTYTASITITSNDPDESLITIPVVLTLAFPDLNETPETATHISVPHQEDYALAPADDVDWYSIHLDSGTTWLIYSERILGSLVDPEVWFYGPHSESGEDVDSTNWIANNDDGHGDRQFEIIVDIAETGYYYLRVASFLDDPSIPNDGDQESKGLTGAYRLIITPSSDADEANPSELCLVDAYPNPATDMIYLSFRLLNEARMKVDVYDVTGKLVLFPVNEHLAPGIHQRRLSTDSLRSGTYIVRFQTNGKVWTSPIQITR